MSDRAPLIHVATEETAPLVVALLNSFVIDFAARSAVGGTDLSYFIIKQLPIIHPKRLQEETGWGCTYAEFIKPRVFELTYTSSEIWSFAKQLGHDKPPFTWNEDRRLFVRCEIDAAFFHLYGIESDDVAYIMETFPIVRRDDESKYGEYRTKRLITEIYDEMASAKMTRRAYKTRRTTSQLPC